jgi:isoleucyl-tRNA synthetase
MQSSTSTPLYPQHRQPDYPAIDREILEFWEREGIFQKSVDNREGAESFTFYEGPPSANGMPGIHHVMARAIKDLFCRYHTLRGKQVKRKAGWDTHGLPIELQVEKSLGITKKDIGVTISVEEYNRRCREDVMKFKHVWDELTVKMGYWVDLEHPYVTFENDYIESVWWVLKQLWDKSLLYKGYSIQPYSPAAGTGLSSHELNQPGAYREVKDTSVVAMFKVTTPGPHEGAHILAWTTTPWTLPANSALAVGANISYEKARTVNPFTGEHVDVIYAAARREYVFHADTLKGIAKHAGEAAPYTVLGEVKGSDLVGLSYARLLQFDLPDLPAPAFTVLAGDFVTTEDGTGIVHMAGTFGADDYRLLNKLNVPIVTVEREGGRVEPIVDRQGKYVDEMGKEFGGRFVKNYTDDPNYFDVDVELVKKLKLEGKAWRSERFEHNYPHCWRTDKPVLYYPLDSWFIATSKPEVKQRLIELNKTINWKPASTGTGRFGNWLENLEDWNLSRSRYWGIPLPIWVNESRTEMKAIGSVEELGIAVQEARTKGFANTEFSVDALDLHKPFIDQIILADSQGRPMRRESDLIDVWFDSGAMPYAQWHYPFENKEIFEKSFPADFIAEGVDQTRGWFFTLHAIAGMLMDKVAFKNVISNGLVLDKSGNKMSKRLGNAVDPFETLNAYGADATRWYLIENAPPWENLKFNLEHLHESQRRFFGTLFNTYQFFALYANIDGWRVEQFNRVPREQLTELDRWIVSRVYTLVNECTAAYDDYDPTRAARAIESFVVNELSNWYVRLCRRRFWKGTMTTDKRAAYETLQHCLVAVAQLISPIAPFFADWLYRNLTEAVCEESITRNTPFKHASVHLTDWHPYQPEWVDANLEARMQLAMDLCSLGHAIRKREKIKVRQPLATLLVAVAGEGLEQRKAAVKLIEPILQSELNVKSVEVIAGDSGVIAKSAKANFKVLGKRYGAQMQLVAKAIEGLSTAQITALEAGTTLSLSMESTGETFEVALGDIEVRTQVTSGLAVASAGSLTIALDVNLTPSLEREGLARELVNRIQNLRKDSGFEVTDVIAMQVEAGAGWDEAVTEYAEYIRAEVLARQLELVPKLNQGVVVELENITGRIHITRF